MYHINILLSVKHMQGMNDNDTMGRENILAKKCTKKHPKCLLTSPPVIW